jgi:hypothetical protein
MRFPGIVKNMSYIVPESVIAFSIYSNTFVIFGFYGDAHQRDDNPKIMIIAKTSRATTTNRPIPVLLSKIPV